jgi:hypothetical protein
MALMLDTATITFIAGWVAPLVRELAHSQELKGSTSGSSPNDVVGHLANFHLVPGSTPNIRDKVSWSPGTHSWKLYVHGIKTKQLGCFVVDRKLSAKMYEEEKIAMYGRAIETWNRLDASKRQRIQLTREGVCQDRPDPDSRDSH